MKEIIRIIWVNLIFLLLIIPGGCATLNQQDLQSDPPYGEGVSPQGESGVGNTPPELSEPSVESVPALGDPLEPVNRAFFTFNDRLYFWILKPSARAYNAVIPQQGRVWVRNFFSNIVTPVRLVSCLLQAKFNGAGTELARFGINTTVGVLGFGDPAYYRWQIKKQEEDLGQTFAVWGIGPAFYIDWPFLGPSTLRDTAGYTGDLFLDPVNYLVTPLLANLGVKAYEDINEVSLELGNYEALKKSSIDPYIALRNAYWQHRIYLIKDDE